MKKKDVLSYPHIHWNLILTAISTVIVVIGVVTTSYLTQFETRINSRAESPTLTPIPTQNCSADDWICNYPGHSNCAKADTRTLFSNTWCDPQCEWLWEDAGRSGLCGGQQSTLRSSGCSAGPKNCTIPNPTITQSQSATNTPPVNFSPTPSVIAFPTNTPIPRNQKYVCSSNCESESDGSYKFCYNQCIVEKPGYSQSIGCNGNGWQYGHDQIDTACGATPTPNPREHEPSPTSKVGGPINILPTQYANAPIAGPSIQPTDIPNPFQLPTPSNYNPLTPLPSSTPTPIPIEDETCILKPLNVLGKEQVFGPRENKLDLIIISDGFDDLPDDAIKYSWLQRMAAVSVRYLKETNLNSVFDEGKPILEKINFWVDTNLTLDYSVVLDTDPNLPTLINWNYDKAWKRTTEQCGGDHYLLIINNMDKEAGTADFGKGSAVTNHNPTVFSHEAGHSIALLGDEYTYPGYSETASPQFDNCSLNPCKWNTTLSTNCIQGCTSSQWFRSTNTSIMENISVSEYNNISIEAWKNILKKYN